MTWKYEAGPETPAKPSWTDSIKKGMGTLLGSKKTGSVEPTPGPVTPPPTPEVTSPAESVPPIINPERRNAEIKFFSTDYIKASIRRLLEQQENVKKIDDLTIAGSGNEIILSAKITASKNFIVTTLITEIELTNAHLINQGNSVGLKEGYSLHATKAEDKIKEIFTEYINSIGTKLREYIENKEGTKVAKMEIVNGELKVTFSAPELKPEPVVAKPETAKGGEAMEKAEQGRLRREAMEKLIKKIAAEERELEEIDRQLAQIKLEEETPAVSTAYLAILAMPENTLEEIAKKLASVNTEVGIIRKRRGEKHDEWRKTSLVSDLIRPSRMRKLGEEINELDKLGDKLEQEGRVLKTKETEMQRQADDFKEQIQKQIQIEALTKDREKYPFKWFLIDSMKSPRPRSIVLGNASLEEINRKFGEDGTKGEAAWYFKTVSTLSEDISDFSSNGFTVEWVNKKEITGNDNDVEDEDKSKRKDPKAKFRVANPQWQYIPETKEPVSYERALEILEEKAAKYQEEMKRKFEDQNK